MSIQIEGVLREEGGERGQCGKLTTSDLTCASVVSLKDKKPLLSQQKKNSVTHCKMEQWLVIQVACFPEESIIPCMTLASGLL